jgi:carbonic anhydrase/acetyltransferase-like protein (isoleucine patch superfamily)
MAVYRLDGVTPDIHPTAYVHPQATVIGRVTLGRDVSIWPQAVLRGDYGEIRIGDRTSIQDGTVLHTTADWPTVLGSDCVVGHLAHLEGCTVGDRALIGSGSIVMNRAVVEDDATVGAGAVLTEDGHVPSGHAALGVPAKIRPLPRGSDWHAEAVSLYVDNIRRYRSLEVVPDEPPTSVAPEPQQGAG